MASNGNEAGDNDGTVPPPHMALSVSTNNLLSQAPASVATQQAAAAGAAAGTLAPISMDMTDLKDSMDAALASIQTEDLPTPVASSDDEKQAQLRAMYLAGFRAAQVQTTMATTNLRDNFESAKTTAPSGITMQLGSAGSSPGVLHTTSPTATRSILNDTPPSLHDPPSTTSSYGRRITRTGSMPAVLSASAPSSQAPAGPVLSSSPVLSAASSSPSSSGTTSGSNPFPRKLMEMLRKEDASVVSWLPAGDAFSVRDADRFVGDILPRYFRHTKLTSFQRQLNLYGFRRITKGPDAGAYKHDQFHREYPDNCLLMKRTKQKGSPQLRPAARNRAGSVTSSPGQTPDLSPSPYSLDPPPLSSLSQSVPTVLPSTRSAQIHGETRQSNFRSGSPNMPFVGSLLSPPASLRKAVAPTGLSVLMSGSVAPASKSNGTSIPNSTSFPNIAKLSLSPSQQKRYQQDMMERENQASALAAAGMVAESVSQSLPQVLHQPPQLKHTPTPPPPSTANNQELDSINWNLMDMGNQINLDDMDLDFATLFDPANELAHIQPKSTNNSSHTHAQASGQDMHQASTQEEETNPKM